MSHHSDDALLVAGSDSFWEPGNYKRTTKRIEDGHRLCNDLLQLIQERAEIEKSYAKGLRNWSKKWNDIIEKGPEYGTMEAAWKGTLAEADRLCELHQRIKDTLCGEIQHKIKEWQKDTYHKSMIQMQIKERKEMEEQFKKVQKPWAKLLDKVNKTKNDYYNACKNEKTALNQEKNASSDSSLSPDQLKKLQDRVQKSKDEVMKCKDKYELALRDIKDYNAKYMEDMKEVFDKCQDLEKTRLQFFQEMLLRIHHCLNISNTNTYPELPQIYEELQHTINNADDEKDLRWWSNNHGVNMAMNWPQFDEYCEEFRDISGKGKRGHLPEGSITLINQRTVGDDLPEYTEINKLKKSVRGGVNSVERNRGASKPDKVNKSPDNSSSSNGVKADNPFEEEEEWEEYPNDALVDTGEPGVPVKALYDYEGAESDELSFKAGDNFEKLEDEDEQGWCKGRKDGKVGLYPANYVEEVAVN